MNSSFLRPCSGHSAMETAFLTVLAAPCLCASVVNINRLFSRDSTTYPPNGTAFLARLRMLVQNSKHSAFLDPIEPIPRRFSKLRAKNYSNLSLEIPRFPREILSFLPTDFDTNFYISTFVKGACHGLQTN
jgi:hypothetical protein